MYDKLKFGTKFISLLFCGGFLDGIYRLLGDLCWMIDLI